ncbi:TetR family transcriptional regulator [Stenotrophomonas maltophilia]|nr:TetR family transcriptional regulator [Stenotrophomonas maltophilia]MBH1503743.1 TetR family transcriptional regulator [Stenotrophomonas maltophilia]
MVRKARVDAEATRERILNSAIDCLCALGVAGTTMEEVAARAGHTRGAVYWHFKGRTELLKAVMKRCLPRLPCEVGKSRILASTSPLLTLREELIAAFVRIEGDVRLRRLWRTLLSSEGSQDVESLYAIYRDEAVFELDIFALALRRSQAQGDLPVALDVGAASRELYISIIGVFYSAIVDSEKFNMSGDGARLFDAHLLGWMNFHRATPMDLDRAMSADALRVSYSIFMCDM